MKALLYTCTLLRIASDAKELSDQAKALFQNTDNAVYLRSVSVWEIIVKNKLGKLPLPDKPAKFVTELCEKHFIENISLDHKAIFHLTTLPDYHRDPFDRMLVCQVIEHDFTILTSDNLITQYPIKTAW
ncbi:MAG: type II toxin-antitoxin system VapC family toxin [Methylococcales bacterium]|nr:type II toxin-antitoxin system VapC family toxin [Methylococcales bacterium]